MISNVILPLLDIDICNRINWRPDKIYRTIGPPSLRSLNHTNRLQWMRKTVQNGRDIEGKQLPSASLGRNRADSTGIHKQRQSLTIR